MVEVRQSKGEMLWWRKRKEEKIKPWWFAVAIMETMDGDGEETEKKEEDGGDGFGHGGGKKQKWKEKGWWFL